MYITRTSRNNLYHGETQRFQQVIQVFQLFKTKFPTFNCRVVPRSISSTLELRTQYISGIISLEVTCRCTLQSSLRNRTRRTLSCFAISRPKNLVLDWVYAARASLFLKQIGVTSEFQESRTSTMFTWTRTRAYNSKQVT